MKKIIALLVSMLFILTAMFFAISAADEGYDGLYVVFGDSIAAGYGLDGSEIGSDESMRYVADRDSDAYAGIVSRALNYDLNNFAASGATTTNLLNKLKTNGILSAVSKADLVTVSIGGNDMIGMASTILPRAAMYEALGGYLEISRTDSSIEQMYETLESNLTEIMQTLVEANNGKGKIYLQTLYNPFKYNKSYTIDFGSYTYNVGDLIDYYINRINDIYHRVQRNVGGFALVDTATAMNGDERCFYEISTPDFHPTAYGHRVIAETILAAYEKPVSTTEATTTIRPTTATATATTDASSSVSTSAIVGSTTHEVTTAVTAATNTVLSTTATTKEATTSTTSAATDTTIETTAATFEATTAATVIHSTTAVYESTVTPTSSTENTQPISTVFPTTASTSPSIVSTTATTASPKTKSGCDSSITGGTAILVISAAVLCSVSFKKKREKIK
ncbi:MAG: hypothetical protein IKI51_01570 [Clostridia bacterium]|nr:hypothetical protein [Clostridia bacterium]